MSIPAKVKILLALVFSAMIFPLVASRLPGAAVPSSFAQLAFGVAGEMLIGLTMGFVLLLSFEGMQVGATLVSQQMGLGLAQLIDPNTLVSSTVLSQLYVLLASLVYVLLNGHLVLLQALIGTFESVPLMSFRPGGGVLGLLVDILTGSFVLGIRVAGPALVAVFLASLALGFISRTMPQLNILAAGFPIRICLSLTVLVASLGAALALFQDSLDVILRTIGEMWY